MKPKIDTEHNTIKRIEMFQRTLAKLKSNIGKSKYLPEIIGNVERIISTLENKIK